MRRLTLLALATAGLAATCSPALAAGQAHEHGALKLDVAIEGRRLTLALEAPLDNLLGFERAPRSDAERQAAAGLLARLRRPDQAPALFTPDAAAQCTLAQAEVQAPLLAPGARAGAADEHADLDASYEYRCARPEALRSLDLGLFDAYPRVQRIEVQVAGPAGQAKQTLRRPARAVRLAR